MDSKVTTMMAMMMIMMMMLPKQEVDLVLNMRLTVILW